MSLIPLWVRLAIIAFLCATCFASGFKLGVDWESNARDAAELKRVKEVVVVTKEIVKWRTKIETKYIDREVIREVEKEKIVQEVDKHVQDIPDPRECWLDQIRIDAINRAVNPLDAGHDVLKGEGATKGPRVDAKTSGEVADDESLTVKLKPYVGGFVSGLRGIGGPANVAGLVVSE